MREALRIARDAAPAAMQRLVELAGLALGADGQPLPGARDDRVAAFAAERVLRWVIPEGKTATSVLGEDGRALDVSRLTPAQVEQLAAALGTIRRLREEASGE